MFRSISLKISHDKNLIDTCDTNSYKIYIKNINYADKL